MIEKEEVKTLGILQKTFEYYGAISNGENKNWDCISRYHKNPKGDLSLTVKNGHAVYACHCELGNGDIFNLVAKMENMDIKNDFSKIMDKICMINNIENNRGNRSTLESNVSTKRGNTQEDAKKEPINDFTEYYNELSKQDREQAIKYLMGRGINRESVSKHGVLFDKKYNSVIFPVSKSHYVYRSIVGDNRGNGKGSIPDISNKELLLQKGIKEIFVTESIIDGLSLNREFISLNSVSNKGKLIESIKQELDTVKDKLFILSLDNDKSGIEAKDYLKKEFKELDIKYTIFSFNRRYKDVNEYLQIDPEGLKKELEIKAYLKPDLVTNYLEQFLKDVKLNKNKEAITTGFKKLDEHLDGGFYPGLYVIGAISSLGKTTFIQQITDNVAATGQDVLFFSLEMSKIEMVCKSLSRLTFDNIKTRTEALTTRQILKGNFNEKMLQNSGTVEKYEKIAKNLSILEGDFDTSILDVRNKIRSYIEVTGEKPFVVIDYLQILRAENKDTGTDKQKIDYIVTELKRISRDYEITLIVISSFNRDNYMTGVSFESFKESGAIEYTADVVFGLQLQVVNRLNDLGQNKTTEKRQIINEAKEATPRKIELVCLKNRNGKSYFKVDYDFYSKFNYFSEGL